ncbi:MAG TPA: ribosome biogenesis GTPase Der [Candidatus Binataceae bacterium]|nr:ribosome biogenesis GTPase Der [Candidatus Binataceae bacterium]
MPKTDSTHDLRRTAANRAIVMLTGRANVGKSTLFNRILATPRAIVSPISGTTRDLNVFIASHEGRSFVIVDSGGLELDPLERAAELAMEEAKRALSAADLIVFVIDGRAGVTTGDRDALEVARQTGRPIVLAVNKVDNPQQEIAAAEAWSLGIESVNFISAAHGRGIGEFLDEVVAHLPEREIIAGPRPTLRLALIGRPNVGKSSLLNRLSGFPRAVVDEHPGTTRDPVELPLQVGEHTLLLIDTAGIRRPTRVEGELEHHSVGRAISTIRRADVLALVIDAVEGFTDQDARLARLVDSYDRALIVVCNKWDLAAQNGRRLPIFIRDTRERHPFLDFAPMLITSARTGDGIDQIVPTASRAGEAWRSEFRTVALNRILAEAVSTLDPPLVGDRRLKPMYVTQVGKAPLRLAVFCNLERDIPVHYERFLEGRFRSALHLESSGTPLRIEFRRARKSREAADRHPNRNRQQVAPAPAGHSDTD